MTNLYNSVKQVYKLVIYSNRLLQVIIHKIIGIGTNKLIRLSDVNDVLLSNRILRYKLQIVTTIIHCKDKSLCKLVINKVIQYMKQLRYSIIDDPKFDIINKRYEDMITDLN
jgi:hypothetical protein